MAARRGRAYLEGPRDWREVWLGTAWDFVGSALGGRSELYERCYLASASRTLGVHHMLAQREQSWNALPEFLVRSES